MQIVEYIKDAQFFLVDWEDVDITAPEMQETKNQLYKGCSLHYFRLGPLAWNVDWQAAPL